MTGRLSPSSEGRDAVEVIEGLLRRGVELDASDIHLKPGAPPAVRLQGELEQLGDAPLSRELVEAGFMTLATRGSRDPTVLLRTQSSFSCHVDGVGRFRCHSFRQSGALALAIRPIKLPIPDMATLRLPPVVKQLATLEQGLVLVTGAQGSGRSTTVAAMLELVNQTRARNVVTLEAPIEHVFEDVRARFHQREVGADVASVPEGLEGALREDADIVFVGAVRSREEVELALAVAESGRLVLSTMHSVGAPRTVESLVGLFPASEKESVRNRLADALAGVVSQRLLPLRNSRRRILVTEVLARSAHVVECIREPRRLKGLHAALEAASNETGAHTFDQRLLAFVRENLVAPDAARAAANHPSVLARQLVPAR